MTATSRAALLPVLLLFAVPLALLRGWVFVHFWRWFVTPIACGIATPTIVQAAGLMVLIAFMTKD